MEPPDKDLIEEYRQRNIRWTKDAISQLTFYNNLLLTLSVGFLSLSFDPENINQVRFTTINFEWSLTFSVASLILVIFSILLGLIISLSRIQDFRLTRQINQIRQRIYEHASIKLKEETPKDYGYRLYLKLFKSHPNITFEEIKKYAEITEGERSKIKRNFDEIRNMAHTLGLFTWRNTKLQTIFFGLSIICYLLMIITK